MCLEGSGVIFLRQEWAQEDFRQSVCWWVGLCFHPVGCFTWGISNTGACRFLGGARSQCQDGDLQESSCPWIFPQDSATRVLVPQWATADPCLPRRHAAHSGPGSYGITALPWVPGHVKPVCTLQEWSPHFPSPAELLHSSPAGLQSQMLWELLLMPDIQAGEPHMGLKTLTPVEEPLRYNYFRVCGSPTWRVWGLIILRKCPSYHLVVASSLSLDVEYLFLSVVSSLFCRCLFSK